MKKFLLIALLLVATLWLASCADSDGPLTESQQAEKFNMSETEFQETKEAAARMNMTIEDHMKMSGSKSGWMDEMKMDMSDDSSMIEDDSEKMNMDMDMDMSNMDGMDMSGSGMEWMDHSKMNMSDDSSMTECDSTDSTTECNHSNKTDSWSMINAEAMHLKMMHKWEEDTAPHDPKTH